MDKVRKFVVGENQFGARVLENVFHIRLLQAGAEARSQRSWSSDVERQILDTKNYCTSGYDCVVCL